MTKMKFDKRAWMVVREKWAKMMHRQEIAYWVAVTAAGVFIGALLIRKWFFRRYTY
ncbi:hypothetical protein R0290_32880 [Burkholderia semiarida]|uniref:hypothetical protein n=1 Tax=Burkholderia TaxID=32008 RepID=UPI00265FFF91|nr:hypothetical protein [Burkholderia sp. AU44665]MDN7700558.1 hypothetical protein [Burkholderia sp. AU44665]